MTDKIIYLDADFIIKLTQTQNFSSTLFDEIMKLPHKFKIVKKVYSEVQNRGTNSKTILTQYVKNGKIELVDNENCLNLVNNYFGQYNLSINIVLSKLEDICNKVTNDEAFFTNVFKDLILLKQFNAPFDEFKNKLNEIIKNNKSNVKNLGEITTLLNIYCQRMVDENIEILSFLSHDKGAKTCILKLD